MAAALPCYTAAPSAGAAHGAAAGFRFSRRKTGSTMKLIIERGALLKALGHVQSVVERRTTIPILSNVLLRLLDAGYKFHHVCGVRTWRYHFHDANIGGRGIDRMHELEKR